MRFACPACQAAFEVPDHDLRTREPMELDCPRCRRVLLLAPTPDGRWHLGLDAVPALPVLSPDDLVPEPDERPQMPRVPATAPSKRDLAAVRLDLPGSPGPSPATLWPTAPEAAAKPSGGGQPWQDFSVMFRVDQAQRSRRRVWLWVALALVLLGGLGSWLWVQRQKAARVEAMNTLRTDLGQWTVEHAAADGDAHQPGTLLSRKLVTEVQVVRRAHDATPPPAAVPPTEAATPTAPSDGDKTAPPPAALRQRLDAACTQAVPELANCARQFMVPRPVRVRLTIGVTGRVEGAWAAGGGDQHPAFVRCLAGRFRQIALGPQELELRYTCVVR